MEKEHWSAPPRWWKKWKPLRWAAVGGIIFVIVTATYTAKVLIAPSEHGETGRFMEVSPDTVLLLDGMRSYDTVERVHTRLDEAKVTYTMTPVHPRLSPKHPPRNRDTLVAAAYKHLGVQGELTLEFFNDRLYEASFVPSDPDSYADKLHGTDTRLKRDRNGRAQQVIGNLRVASNVAFSVTEVGRSLQTKPFVIWQDLRLVEQLDEWDRRFVVLPQKN